MTTRYMKQHCGRRVYGTIAGIGPIMGELAQDKATAKASAETAVLDALARLDQGGRTFEWNGIHLTIFPSLYGWSYVFDGMYCQNEAHGTREDAYRHALHHAAQNAWTVDTDDVVFLASVNSITVRDEMKGWITWQRNYRRLVAEGKSDAVARQEASA